MSGDPWAAMADDPFAPPTTIRTEVRHAGRLLRCGDRVVLRPRGGADILDIALRGMTATIESVEVDYEDRVHLAVTVDDDPGRDLGRLRQPGHRFFFALEDVEPIDVEPADAGGPG